MTASLLDDAMAHHIWATESLIDLCAELPADALSAPTPGAYGSILDTLRHLVRSDCFFLTFFREGPARIAEDAEPDLAELRIGDRRQRPRLAGVARARPRRRRRYRRAG